MHAVFPGTTDNIQKRNHRVVTCFFRQNVVQTPGMGDNGTRESTFMYTAICAVSQNDVN